MDGLYHQSPPYLNGQQMYRPHSIDHHHDLNWSSNNNTNSTLPRPKITTNVWEDEGTLCFQVDAKGICVARRQGMFVFIHIKTCYLHNIYF